MFLIMSRMARYIPQELVEQILIKLPPKSLIRFSTVSKGCYHFIQTLKSIENRTPFLLAISSKKNQYNFYTDNVTTFQEYARLIDLENVKSAEPVSCSNGVICFSDYQHRVVLWNPSIHKIFYLPKSDIELLFDNNRFPFGVIVDYDKNDYKVLRTDNCGEEISYVEIFRMSTGSWELLDYDVSKAPFSYICKYQVDLKRVSYWVAKDMDFKVTIISFDWSDESFGAVKIPAPVKEEGKSLWFNCEAYLYLLEESLVLLYSVRHEIDDLFNDREDSDEEGDVKNYDEDVITYTFWKMEDSEGESWMLMWNIFFKERMRPLGFRENGEFLWAENNGGGHLISTNLDKGSHRRLGSCGETRIYSCLNYVESLALRDVTSQVSRPPRSEKVVKPNK